MSKKKKMKPIWKVLLSLLLVVVLAAGGYIVYLLVDFHRVPDRMILSIYNGNENIASTGVEYKIMTYNIGFCAYTADYGFFMDGGTESRAASKGSVISVINNITTLIKGENPDFVVLQEVDVDGTRSYHVDERAYITSNMSNYDATDAISYDSSYLAYPFLEPHGKNKSVLMVLSKYNITSGLRRQLPIENSLMKFFDCDRCYSVNRIPVDNGKELIIYGSHFSAYTSDGTISDEQTRLLIEDMKYEYAKGNYVILGADFNKDILGDSSKYFGKADIEYTWAQPLYIGYLEGTGLSVQAPIDEEHPVPSCRNADGPYHEGQFVVTIDGFITSDNVEVISSEVVDTGFAYSDHNPVTMEFILK